MAIRLGHREQTSPTTTLVESCLREGTGCFVVGSPGSGKSYAVSRAINGAGDAVWVDLAEGPYQQTRFFVDVARQVQGGRDLLAAVAERNLDVARKRASDLINGRALIVDRAERLLEETNWSWDEPAEALWQSQQVDLAAWLRGRANERTVLVGQHRPSDWPTQPIRHEAPARLTVRPEKGSEGQGSWEHIANAVRRRPGGLALAQAALPFLTASAFDSLAKGLDEDAESNPVGIFRTLAEIIRERAPTSWHRVLTILEALDGGERELVEQLVSGDERPALSALRRVGLIRERDGRLYALSTLIESGGLGRLGTADRHEVLVRTANHLRTQVNDLQTLDPEDADRVYRAHSLYVQAGEFDGARRTARLHVAGLIDLARRTSVEKRDWDNARLQYQAIRDLLAQHPDESETGRQTLSYVKHYLVYNGDHGGALAPAEVLTGYEEAVRLWPGNALWQQRYVETLLRLGRVRDALSAVKTAYSDVDEHPRRDTYLRVRPAQAALSHGAALASLSLLEPVLDLISWDSDPEGASTLDDVMGRWAQGVQVRELPHEGGVLIFKREIRVEAKKLADQWRARPVSFVAKPGWGILPTAALHDMAGKLVEEIQGLLVPSHLLPDERVRRKSLLISRVDTLNSDLGLEHATHRWLLGRMEGRNLFVPVQRTDLEPVEVSGDLAPDGETPGLFMARVPVFRDGYPSGSVEKLVPAGNGRSLEDLVTELARRSESDSTDDE